MDWEIGKYTDMQQLFNIYAAYCSFTATQSTLQVRLCVFWIYISNTLTIYVLASGSAASSSSILESTLFVSECETAPSAADRNTPTMSRYICIMSVAEPMWTRYIDVAGSRRPCRHVHTPSPAQISRRMLGARSTTLNSPNRQLPIHSAISTPSFSTRKLSYSTRGLVS